VPERSLKAVIVGAGFGGVTAAIELRRQGVEDIVVLEKRDGLGGVWRANTYPGAACDVPSHLYSLSYAPNPDWSRRFAPGPEIRGYLGRVAREHDVLRHMRFGVEVAGADWDEGAGRWRVALKDGEALEADILAVACGQLSIPAIPALPGLDTFAGPAFHSADWDHDVDLTGKNIAVVGTGASAIQFAPEVAKQAAHMTVFQRSAPWTLPKNDNPYPAWRKTLYRRFPALQEVARAGHKASFEAIVPVFVRRPEASAKIAARVVRTISALQRRLQLRGDPELLAGATPDYELGCKRVLLTSDWLPMLRRENVSLVTQPISEVVPEGVRTPDGVVHPADVIVYGTGFASTAFVAPMEIRGRDGAVLSEVWRDGAEAYLGIAVPRFPNLFLLYGPNTNHGTGSIITVLEAAARWIGQAAALLREGRLEAVEVRGETHDAFQRELAARLRETVWATGGCTSTYHTAEGRIVSNWPGSHTEFESRTRHLALGDLVGANAG
jgi:cation diffusion facilitator CzcD-associated flavoprotein CzcO